MDNKPSVYKKLSKARQLFHQNKLTKTGRNDFQHYSYFELSDFLPDALNAFDEAGIVGIVTFGTELATLAIVDIETGESVTITSPMSTAELKGCHPVQNLGAVQTYTRRYLWSAAMELIEGDAVDGSKPPESGSVVKSAPKTPPRGVQRQETASLESTTWQGTIDYAETKQYDGVAKSGKPYTLYRVTLDDGRTATTFDETLFKTAKTWDVLHEIMLRVAPNKRSSKPDTWELLDVQKVEQEKEGEPW